MQIKGQQERHGDGEFPFCEERGFRAVVFDWDGVLVDSGTNYYRAYEMVLADVGITTTPREIYLREGQPTGELLTVIIEQHGRAVDSSEIKQMVERRRGYDIALGERKLFEGVWELLRRLRKAKLGIGMVTGSSRKSVERVLTAELAKAFDIVITADEVVRPKPNPQPFLLAASRLDLLPTQCVVVENAPFGIRGARAAGCEVIGLCTTLSPEDLAEAHWVVRNHRELEALLSSRNAGWVGTRG